MEHAGYIVLKQAEWKLWTKEHCHVFMLLFLAKDMLWSLFIIFDVLLRCYLRHATAAAAAGNSTFAGTHDVLSANALINGLTQQHTGDVRQ